MEKKFIYIYLCLCFICNSLKLYVHTSVYEMKFYMYLSICDTGKRAASLGSTLHNIVD